MRWSVWIPYPGSWLSAIALILLTGGLRASTSVVWRIAEYLGRISPRLGFLFVILALVSPILMIAIAHHLLHLFLDQFFPDTRSPETGNAGGLPNLISWWEGMYGWLVILLATLLTTGVLGTFSSLDSLYELYEMLSAWDKTGHLLRLPMMIWVVIAAYLYQFQHLTQQHLISVGSNLRRDRI